MKTKMFLHGQCDVTVKVKYKIMTAKSPAFYTNPLKSQANLLRPSLVVGAFVVVL